MNKRPYGYYNTPEEPYCPLRKEIDRRKIKDGNLTNWEELVDYCLNCNAEECYEDIVSKK